MPAILMVELQPFMVPNFVREVVPPVKRQAGFIEAPCHPLSAIDVATLDRMCRDFRAAVFAKAGKPLPVPPNSK